MTLNETDVWDIAQHIMPEGATNDDAYHETLSPSANTRRLYTVDTFVEGRHFTTDWQDYASIAWRCLAASVSDIAACGGRPLGMLIGLTLPQDVSSDAVHLFYKGLHHARSSFAPDLQLWGGDTTTGPCWIVSITVIGEVNASVKLTRGEARHRDILIATGFHGLSGVGLQVLTHQADVKKYSESIERFTLPTPRLAAGQFLAEHIPHAALMDSSDGLADAALKIAKHSTLQAILDEGLIPKHPQLDTAFNDEALRINPLNMMLYGGEDFELVAAITSTDWHTHQVDLERLGFGMVGYMQAYEEGTPYGFILREDGDLDPLDASAMFNHFDTPDGEENP